jgi:hypothetical protein
MAKKGSTKKSGVEPFEDNINDDVDDIDNGEEVMAAKNKNKSNRRNRIEAEVEAEEDETEVEDEETDEDADDEDEDESDDEESDDEDEEDDDEDEPEAEPVDLGFNPFIIHEDADWELTEVIDEADPGESIYFYRPPADEETPAKWYKLQSIEVGEKS